MFLIHFCPYSLFLFHRDDDFSEMSESKGGDSDEELDNDAVAVSNSNREKRGSIKSNIIISGSNTTHVESPNKVLELQKRIKELEEKNKKDSSIAIQEREELMKKVKFLEDSLVEASSSSSNSALTTKEIEEAHTLINELKKEIAVRITDQEEDKKQIERLMAQLRNTQNSDVNNNNNNNSGGGLVDNDRWKSLLLDNEKLQAEAKDARKQLTSLQVTLDQERQQAKEKAKKAMEDFDKLMDDYDDLKAKMVTNTSSENQKQQHQALFSQKEMLESEVKKLKSDILDGKNREKEMKKQIEQMEVEKSEIIAHHNNETKNKGKTNKTIDDLTLQLSLLQKEKTRALEELQKKNERLEKETNEANAFIDRQKQTIGDIGSKLEELQSQNHDLKLTVDDLHGKLEDLRNEANTIQIELNESRKIVEDLKGKLQELSNASIERFVLENALIFAPVQFYKEIPIPVKILYDCLIKWDAFDPAAAVITGHQTFVDNMSLAIEFLPEMVFSSIPKALFSMNILYRILNLLKEDHPQLVSKVFNKCQLEESARGHPEVPIPSLLSVIKELREYPSFLTATEKLNSRQGKLLMDDNIMKLSESIHSALTRCYLLLISDIIQKLWKEVHLSLFEITKDNIVQGYNHLSTS